MLYLCCIFVNDWTSCHISTFMGRSSPEDEVCKQTPRSADPAFIEKEDIKEFSGGIFFFFEHYWGLLFTKKQRIILCRKPHGAECYTSESKFLYFLLILFLFRPFTFNFLEPLLEKNKKIGCWEKLMGITSNNE